MQALQRPPAVSSFRGLLLQRVLLERSDLVSTCRGGPLKGWGGDLTPMELNPDPQAVLAVAAWVVAFLFGKHLQAGYAQWRRTRAAEQPVRRDR